MFWIVMIGGLLKLWLNIETNAGGELENENISKQ